MAKKIVIFLIIAIIIGAVVLVAGAFAMFKGKHSNNSAAGRIGVITIDGVITGGRGQGGFMGGNSGTDTIIKQLREAKDDPSIKAIILRINSPGGSAPAAQEVGVEIKKIRDSGKPVVTSMGDIAASGGYWIAALTEKIYANPATITGSIGVYMPYMNYEELMRKIGVREEKIKSGPYKDIMSPERPMTPEERAIIQGMVDDIYAQFINVVAEGRKMDPAKVRTLADGRIYTGRQAKDAGLVDELGDLYDTIDATAKQAGIAGTPEIKEFGKASAWDIIFGAEEKIDIRGWLLQKFVQQADFNNAAIPMPLYQRGLQQ